MPTKISWTDETWNPVVGCSKCSIGCQNCYAERMMYRQVCMGAARHLKDPDGDELAWIAYSDVMDEDTHGWNGNISLRYSELDKPLHWKKPRRIFVCSMGDLFHEAVPDDYIYQIFNIIRQSPCHIYLMLTKRIRRLLSIYKKYPARAWPISKNLHLGVSISNQAEADEKIPILLQISAAVRFVSLEPLLGEIDLHLGRLYARPSQDESPTDIAGYKEMIHWVIIGCESINGRVGRFQDGFNEAAINLVRQCKAAGVPPFVKQIPRIGCRKCGFEPCTHLHGHRRKVFLIRDKRLFWPEELRVQEMPNVSTS